MTETQLPRLGKLAPLYSFVLNPHPGTPVSRCPICEQRMHQRKVPLFIHIEPFNPVVLGFTCRFCPACDLLIAHQDRLEALLAAMFAERDPSIIGNDYLVLGTVESAAWRTGLKGPQCIGDMLENLHDFKEVRTLQFRPAGWYPADEPGKPGEPAAAGKRTGRPAPPASSPGRGIRRKRSRRR